MTDQYVDLPLVAGSAGVTDLNGLTGSLTLAAGTGITITPAGNTLTLAATGATSVLWGDIIGTLSNQTDLQTELDLRANYKGQWLNPTQYFPNDLVIDNGIIYICIAENHSGTPVDHPTLWTPFYQLAFPILADPGLVTSPSYGFNEGGNDTGMWSQSAGLINWSNNSTLGMTLDDSHNLTVVGTITASNYPPLGNDGTFAGFDPVTGSLESIQGWDWIADGGSNIFVSRIVPTDAGDVFTNVFSQNSDVLPTQNTTQYHLVGCSNTFRVDPASTNFNLGADFVAFEIGDFKLGDGADGNHHAFVINQQIGSGTAGSTGDAGTTQINSSIQVGLTAHSFDSRYLNFQNNGTITNDYRADAVDLNGSGIVSGSLIGYEINDQLTVSGSVTLSNLNMGGPVAQNMQGINVSLNATVGGDVNMVNLNLNESVTGSTTGINIGIGSGKTYANGITLFNGFNNGALTGSGKDFTGLNLGNAQGAPQNNTGVNIDLDGTSQHATGMNINMATVVTGEINRGINVNGGAITNNYEVSTAIFSTGANEFQINELGSEFTIALGSPISDGSFGFLNNIGSSFQFNDDMGPDFTGVHIGLSMNGSVGQIVGALGKTVDSLSFMIAGASVPPTAGDGGTITSLSFYRAIGLLPEGGNLALTNVYGFRVDPLLSSLSPTNAWGVWVSDTNADNWFAKDVVIGGSTGKPTSGKALDVTGDSIISGDIAAATLTPANGASGTFTTVDAKTVTVLNGIITSIV